MSYANRENVVDRIKDGAPRTFVLAIGAAIIWFVCGVALGLFSAVKAGKASDRGVTVLALIGISMPVFWLGALMSYYLGYKAGLFPNGGYVPISQGGVFDWLYHLILPWIALSVLFIGVYSRVVRSSVLDTINDDYVRTARAKGLGEKRVLRHHVLRNSLIPVITLWGLDFGAVLGGGAILTETVFDIQGVGQYFSESISRLDVPPVLAITHVRRVLHRPLQRDRGHRLRGARPTDPALMTNGKLLLDVEHLRVGFRTEDGVVQAVDDVSFQLRAGEVLAIVGESGSGKSVSALTLMGLTPRVNAHVRRHGDAARARTSSTRATTSCAGVRGEEIAMIFQDPMTSLNPVQRIGAQIVEQIQAHRDIGDAGGVRPHGRAARARRHPARPGAHPQLPARVLRRHAPARDDRDGAVVRPVGPHRRRAHHRARRDDPGADPRGHAGAARADRRGHRARDARPRRRGRHRRPHRVMYAGRIVEQGTVDEIFYDPQHPYTWGLLGLDRPRRPAAARAAAVDPGPAAVAAQPRPQGCHFRPRCRHEFGQCRAGAGARGARSRPRRLHTDRCWLPLDEKRSKREIADGQIGLEAKGVIA